MEIFEKFFSYKSYITVEHFMRHALYLCAESSLKWLIIAAGFKETQYFCSQNLFYD